MKQSRVFMEGEGEAWLERNKQKLPPKYDPVLAAIEEANIQPRNVLEIGCANGWRLIELEKRYQCKCSGIDPGVTHSPPGLRDRVTLYRNTAEDLWSFSDGNFDLLIYGFCLYLCDPEDYFEIAWQADRVLADGGYIIIHDFAPPLLDQPWTRPYEHKEGVVSHRMRWESLWTWHPAYSFKAFHIQGEGDDTTRVVVLQKTLNKAFLALE